MRSSTLSHAPEISALLRRFDFGRDSFAFANELIFEYRLDEANGKMRFARRDPPPDYAHRCFVLTRAARQFFYHAQFEENAAPLDQEGYRRRIREVIQRNPRIPSAPAQRVPFPGYGSLREFSAAWEAVLKQTCGGAWRSYILRSHWRMVFPISRKHQMNTAQSLLEKIKSGLSPIVHLVRFPALTINHGMIFFEAAENSNGILFKAYDPNDPAKPTELSFDYTHRTFHLPATRYWAGGKLDIIEIFKSWLL